MLKQIKSISTLLLLMGTSVGTSYAAGYTDLANVQVFQQNGECHGVIKDSNGEAIIGASVLVKGTTNGTITGLDGDFTLSGLNKGDIIQVSFIGYLTQEVKWTGQPVSVTLKEDKKTLDEVVVIGYGTQKKAD